MKLRNVQTLYVLMFPWAFFANPQSPVIAAGDASFQTPFSEVLEIIASDRSIIEWNDFSIETGETVRFIQPNSNAAVLNRVVDAYPSRLMGHLESNGQVLLINPKGILIGKEARIDIGSLIASTLDLQNELFLSGKEWKFSGDSLAAIENQGTIEAENGPVALIGHEIHHTGSIESSKSFCALLAGNEVLIRIDPSSPMYVRTHTLDPENVFAGVFRTSEVAIQGSLHAPGQEVYVMGDSIWIQDGAAIDVSSKHNAGTVLIGGDAHGSNANFHNASTVLFEKDARIEADSLEEGNGGKVILWSDKANGAFGSISARGGSHGGDGGFVEISSLGPYAMRSFIDVGAPFGKGGEILLDPTDITIGAADINDLPLPACPAAVYAFTANTASIDVATLQVLLANAGCSVTISTANAFIGAPLGGAITVNNAFTWASNANLNLTANTIIQVNPLANITPTGTGSITLTAPSINILANIQNSNSGDVILDATNTIVIGNGANPIAVGSQFGLTSIGNPAQALCNRNRPNVTIQGGTVSMLAANRLGFSAVE